MTLLVSSQPVPLVADDSGVLRVGNTKVPLDSVVYGYKRGATAEQIAFDFPTLNLADIHAVLSYYLRNREQVEQYLTDQQLQADDVRTQIKSIVASGDVRERLQSRRDARNGKDTSDA